MTRWSILRVGAVAALLAILAWAAVNCGTQASAPAARANVTLVYVGAEDCAPCRVWQAVEGRRLLDSSGSARLTYREVKSPTLRDVLKDEYWPEDLRGYRSAWGPGRGCRCGS